ncbi:hypothetical protein IER10_004397 [Salmonella enterica]|nr:hypothetical protein [Escherichia coli]EIF5335951.1 hypothetical protein [Salmonella enterica]
MEAQRAGSPAAQRGLKKRYGFSRDNPPPCKADFHSTDVKAMQYLMVEDKKMLQRYHCFSAFYRIFVVDKQGEIC